MREQQIFGRQRQLGQQTEYTSLVMREAAKEAAVLLYAPGADPCFKELVKSADRVFYFDERLRDETRIAAKANPRASKSQTTLETFS